MLTQFMHRVEYVENWRRISDYIPEIKDFYFVSDRGRIYSDHVKRIMRARISKKGYLEISLALKGDVERSFYTSIHRLVCVCFNYVENWREMQVNHIYGFKDMNYPDQLEWVSNRENMDHAMANNLITRGQQRWNCSITDMQAHKICQYLQIGMPYKDIAKYVLGMDKLNKNTSDLISSMRNGRHFNHIRSQYYIDLSKPHYQIFNDQQIEIILNCCQNKMDNSSILKYMNYELNDLPNEVVNKLNNDLNAIRNGSKFSRN